MGGGIMNPRHLLTEHWLPSSLNLRNVTYVVRFFWCHSLGVVFGLFRWSFKWFRRSDYSSWMRRAIQLVC